MGKHPKREPTRKDKKKGGDLHAPPRKSDETQYPNPPRIPKEIGRAAQKKRNQSKKKDLNQVQRPWKTRPSRPNIGPVTQVYGPREIDELRVEASGQIERGEVILRIWTN